MSAKGVESMITSRQKLILKAIVEHYVDYAEPVGSKALTDKPYLHYSSATIRYDMARLEELGLLEKTHTSSGRIPSEAGFKYYVSNLVTRDSEVVEDFPLVDELFNKHGYSRQAAVEKAINLLSDLTNYTALAVGPNDAAIKINKIDFIPTSVNEAVTLIVTDKGHVHHQNIIIPEEISMKEVKEVIETLDELLRGRLLDDAKDILKSELAKQQIGAFVSYQQQILNSFVDAFSKFAQDNYYFSGISNAFDQPEFSDTKQIKKFVNMLNKRELVNFISGKESLAVTFGSDIELQLMENFSIISIPYRINAEDKGTIAVLGPTRMDYSKVIPLLEYIALNLGKLYRK